MIQLDELMNRQECKLCLQSRRSLHSRQADTWLRTNFIAFGTTAKAYRSLCCFYRAGSQSPDWELENSDCALSRFITDESTDESSVVFAIDDF